MGRSARFAPRLLGPGAAYMHGGVMGLRSSRVTSATLARRIRSIRERRGACSACRSCRSPTLNIRTEQPDAWQGHLRAQRPAASGNIREHAAYGRFHVTVSRGPSPKQGDALSCAPNNAAGGLSSIWPLLFLSCVLLVIMAHRWNLPKVPKWQVGAIDNCTRRAKWSSHWN